MNDNEINKNIKEEKFEKYTKKPVRIDAYQTDEEIEIETLEGTMKADVGDYIIKGVKGELYPCKPDVFNMTYSKSFANIKGNRLILVEEGFLERILYEFVTLNGLHGFDKVYDKEVNQVEVNTNDVIDIDLTEIINEIRKLLKY